MTDLAERVDEVLGEQYRMEPRGETLTLIVRARHLLKTVVIVTPKQQRALEMLAGRLGLRIESDWDRQRATSQTFREFYESLYGRAR